MRVALATQHADAAFTPLALLYLRAALVARGHDAAAISIVECDRDASAEAIADRLLATSPDIVGLSCYVWNVTALLEASRIVKARRPAVRIVLGGPEVGPIAETVLGANPAVDVVVCSEGEQPFAALVEAWQRGGTAASVAGIACREHGRVVLTEAAAIVRDIGDLPSPHLGGGHDAIETAGRVICLETQRGCVFRCNFCFYNKDLSIRNRRFDLDRVKSELAHWLAQDVAEIYLMDPIFNLYADRAKAICRFLAERNTRGIGIHAEVWAEFIDDEMARLMRAANFRFVEVGLQSTDDTALATVERRLRMQRFLEGVHALTRHGIHWELQLIFGLPGETRDTFRRSLNFANALDAPELAVYPLMVLPGTELWRKAPALGLEFDPEPPYTVRSHYSMSRDDVAYGMRVVRALQEVGDYRSLRILGRERGLTYADVLDAWLERDGAEQAVESTPYRVKQFLVDFCADRHTPADFYRGFASWEAAG